MMLVRAGLLVLSLLLALPVAADEPPGESRRIVLLAGPPDEHHPAGTHEYRAALDKLKTVLEDSNIREQVSVILVEDGWPADPAVLETADTIVVYSAGADRRREDHPLLVPGRLEVLDRQMQRGCGLVLLHWSVFWPEDQRQRVLDWIGGYFDYETGPPPKNWYSAITTAEAQIKPATPHHPLARGLESYRIRDEWYYSIRFQPDDPAWLPVLTAQIDGVETPQTIGWARQRPQGGRGFGFTGGHFLKNFDQVQFQTAILNAIAWTAGLEIPPGGVHKRMTFDEQWTPRPRRGGKALPYERENDSHWNDPRVQRMDYGPVLTSSIRDPRDTMIPKAMAFRLDDQAGALFDKERLLTVTHWTGGFLDFKPRRYGLLEFPTLAGEAAFGIPHTAQWQVDTGSDRRPAEPRELRYLGLRMSDPPSLHLRVAGRRIVQSLEATTTDDHGRWFRQQWRVGPGTAGLEAPLAQLPEGGEYGVSEFQQTRLHFHRNRQTQRITAVASLGDLPEIVRRDHTWHVRLPAAQEPKTFELLFWHGPEDAWAAARGFFPEHGVPEIADKRRGHALRWGEPLVTQGQRGTDDGPLALDTINLPFENPFNALLFTSGLDFTADGTCYVATAHGDVWKVTGLDDTLRRVEWQRFATGLYQPLGLRVRDEQIYVLGRDQITRLEDRSGNGEADWYENFNDGLRVLGQPHAYAACLETDAAGNFYFLKSGAASTPHGGTLLKVSADGRTIEPIATGFRHPNGLGLGPDGTLTAADNEGNWIPATRIDRIWPGKFCGFMNCHHRETPPETYDEPLCWLPRSVDNSAGGQVWVPEGQWGPLSGAMLHLSFGHCTVNLVLQEQVDGVWQGGAVALPLPRFLSGVCRGRFAPHDGHLYVCGLDGWQTAAVRDGCLQRVRWTGRGVAGPVGLHVHANGLRLEFGQPVDRDQASDPSRYQIEQWQYRWTRHYGSEDYKISNPDEVGQDRIPVTAAHVSEDGRQVFLEIENLQPVMQMRIQAGLSTGDGQALPVDVFNTIHRLGPAFAR